MIRLPKICRISQYFNLFVDLFIIYFCLHFRCASKLCYVEFLFLHLIFQDFCSNISITPYMVQLFSEKVYHKTTFGLFGAINEPNTNHGQSYTQYKQRPLPTVSSSPFTLNLTSRTEDVHQSRSTLHQGRKTFTNHA